MKLDEYFITNLVSERIPMIRDWAHSTGVEMFSTYQSEQRDISGSFSIERVGYKLLDKIERAYVSHQNLSNSYTAETHYLLGMYLRALAELENLNFLHLYNCAFSYKDVGSKRIWTVPVIKGREYTFRANTYFPIKLIVTNSLKPNGANITKSFDILTSNSSDYQLLGSTSERAIFSWDDILSNSFLSSNYDEFYEFEFQTSLFTQIAVIEGNFIKPNTINEDSTIIKPKPFVLASYAKYSNKLIEALLGTLITDKSNSFIKQKALQLYPASTIAQAAKQYTQGIYDIDDYIDKRLIV